MSSGKKDVVVPYRNSVLTKLLQNAIGGNSRTVMLATISPAAINYEETLSTLRYADRAKQIKNHAVVNESPTDKLIRELKEENARLMAQLKAGNMSAEMEESIKANEYELQRQIEEINQSWEQRLEQARVEWEQNHTAVSMLEHRLEIEPFLQNVNEDAQLSGMIRYIIEEGRTLVGRVPRRAEDQDEESLPEGFDMKISLSGASIHPQHAVFTRKGGQVVLEAIRGASVLVNGQRIVTETVLRHQDRIILAPNHYYIFVSEKTTREGAELQIDFENMQSEMAAYQNVDAMVGAGATGKSTDMQRIRDDLVSLLPMIAEANAISEELHKSILFELVVKSGASHDLNDREKKVMVKMTDSVNMFVWLWSREKFINRKYLMQELYQDWVDGNPIDNDPEKDPFWDPPEDFFLGSVYVYLQSLAYAIDIDETMSITNYQGLEEGVLQVGIYPCDPSGNPMTEDMFVSAPAELLSKRLDFLVKIPYARGIKWVQEDPTRGVVCKYTFYTDAKQRCTKSVKGTMNPEFSYAKQFTIKSVSQSFLNYLENNALVIEVWGTQGKGTMRQKTIVPPRPNSVVRNNTMTTVGGSDAAVADADLDSAFKEAQWLHEKRDMQRTIEELQQEVQLLTIEKGVLESEVSSVTLQSSTESADPSLALMEAVRAFVTLDRQQRQNIDRLNAKGNKLVPDDLKSLKNACEQQAREVKRITKLLETSANDLKNAAATLGKKK